MLIRIVRMVFKEDKVEEFLSNFEISKEKIRHFEGCHHLELLQDFHKKNCYVTYSFWENEDFLNKYRKSDLFRGVWAKTKILFVEKPIAYSLNKVQEV